MADHQSLPVGSPLADAKYDHLRSDFPDRVAAYLTAHGPLTVPQIAEGLDAPAGAVSSALHVLEDAGRAARDGSVKQRAVWAHRTPTPRRTTDPVDQAAIDRRELAHDHEWWSRHDSAELRDQQLLDALWRRGALSTVEIADELEWPVAFAQRWVRRLWNNGVLGQDRAGRWQRVNRQEG